MRGSRRHGGFTLIELLVVIGIIAVLLAILLPVVSSIRKSAQTAATQNRMTQISNAIHAYYLDNHGYPGAVPNSEWGTSPPTPMPLDPKLTSSEDMTLAILGGTELDATGKWVFDPAKDPPLVGTGPISLNKLSPGKKNAYMAFRAEELSPRSGTAFVPLSTQEQLSYVQDSAVPEFIDAYPEYRPILYLRANPGAAAGVSNANVVSTSYVATKHYNLQSVAGYLKATDVLKADASDGKTREYFAAPMTNSSGMSVVTAKYAGTYILISAGPDRIFGTSDDVIVGGGGGQ